MCSLFSQATRLPSVSQRQALPVASKGYLKNGSSTLLHTCGNCNGDVAQAHMVMYRGTLQPGLKRGSGLVRAGPFPFDLAWSPNIDAQVCWSQSATTLTWHDHQLQMPKLWCQSRRVGLLVCGCAVSGTTTLCSQPATIPCISGLLDIKREDTKTDSDRCVHELQGADPLVSAPHRHSACLLTEHRIAVLLELVPQHWSCGHIFSAGFWFLLAFVGATIPAGIYGGCCCNAIVSLVCCWWACKLT
jgi:hypothetical protein